MKKIVFTIIWSMVILSTTAQPWVQNNTVFNPSGIPSLPFSQPRFADLDADGDSDLIIGSINAGLTYFENTSSAGTPSFVPGADIFANIDELDAEVGVFFDLDADGDPDLVTGGYTGLNLFENTGITSSPEFEKIEGFFDGLNAGQLPVPDMADIDGDADADLVVGQSESGLVKIYINIGTTLEAMFTEAESYEIGDVGLYAYPVFGDPDDDGDQDLLVGKDTYGFVFYKNTGNPQNAVWEEDPAPFEGLGMDTYWNSPDLVDLNDNEVTDLVFGTAAGPLNYFENNGTFASPDWIANTTLFGGVLDVGGASNPCFFDFDNDGDLDMFSGSQLGDILYYENTGTAAGPAWQENSGYFTSLKHSIYSAVAVGDVNADGLPDAIIGDLLGNLYYHRNTGIGFAYEPDALQNIALGGWSVPRLIDFDADNDLDIVAGNEDGNLAYIENQGTPEEPVWILIPGIFDGVGVNSNCVPTLSDVDFDGDIDVLCGNMSGDLFYFEQDNGNWIPNTDVFQGISVDQNAAPALADLDNDGDDDLTIGEYSGVFNYFQNKLMTVGTGDKHITAEALVFPNPITASANLVFYLESPGPIRLTIATLAGQVMVQQSLEAQNTGKQTINLETQALPPGIFFIRLDLTSTSKILKIVKL